jgi:hypothetical protein
LRDGVFRCVPTPCYAAEEDAAESQLRRSLQGVWAHWYIAPPTPLSEREAGGGVLRDYAPPLAED